MRQEFPVVSAEIRAEAEVLRFFIFDLLQKNIALELAATGETCSGALDIK